MGVGSLSPSDEVPGDADQPVNMGSRARLCVQGGGATAQQQGRGSLSGLWTRFHTRVKTQQAMSLKTCSVLHGDDVSVKLKGYKQQTRRCKDNLFIKCPCA